MDTAQAYGLWVLVAVNSAIFILFAISFFHPQSRSSPSCRTTLASSR